MKPPPARKTGRFFVEWLLASPGLLPRPYQCSRNLLRAAAASFLRRQAVYFGPSSINQYTPVRKAPPSLSKRASLALATIPTALIRLRDGIEREPESDSAADSDKASNDVRLQPGTDLRGPQSDHRGARGWRSRSHRGATGAGSIGGQNRGIPPVCRCGGQCKQALERK